MIDFFNLYWKPIAVSISLITLFIGIIKIVANSMTISKIQNNEILHITADINAIKKEDKDFKKGLKNEIHNIFLAIKRIEKKQTIRDTICETRHGKNIQS